MINISLRSKPINGNKPAYCYRVAQQRLMINHPFDALHGFEQVCSDPAVSVAPLNPVIPMNESRQLYQGPGWIGNEWREVNCRSAAGGYQIKVAGISDSWVADDGAHIIIEPEPDVDKDLVTEAALGPALILALALHDVFCLHGSAVMSNGKVIIFLGESGKGKSTLARWLDQQEGGPWQRVGDDILPVSLSSGHLEALPHFPQLKLLVGEQPSIGLPERLPIAAVYVLGRPTADERVEIRVRDAQNGTLSLVRHSVASRLFDADLLLKHLDFCAQAATQTQVKELIYPLLPEILPAVRDGLLEDLHPRQFPLA